MKAHKGFFVFWAFFFTLFIFVTEGYSSTITANAGPGGIISPSGSVWVPDGADQTFNVTPGGGGLDVLVDNISVGAVSSYTFRGVTGDHTITASFGCNNPPVMMESDQSYYDAVMAAHASGVAGSLNNYTIRMMAGTLNEEDLYFAIENESVVLKGGYDCSFQNNTMLTTIPGSLTIAAGTVTVSNLVLSPGTTTFCQAGDPVNFPGNTEICDNLDNNCNGMIDEGLSTDADGDGHTAIGSCSGTADDCDDHDAHNFPGNPEICDGKDNNCNGQADEGLLTAVDADHDGYTSNASGTCGGSHDDCNDNNASIHPGATEYFGDGIDQNCDGKDMASAETTCFECHAIGNINTTSHVIRTPDATCKDCHSAIVSNALGHYGRIVSTAGNNMTAGSVIGCFSCHDRHDDEFYYKWPGANIVWQKIDRDYPNINCDTCHETRAASHAAGHVNRIIDNACGHCHTSDTSHLGSPGNGTLASDADVNTLHRSNCMVCHGYTTATNTTIAPATVRQAINNGVNGTQITCTTCHGVFATIHPQTVNHTALINVGTTGCGNCHHNQPPLVDPTSPKVHHACTTCHTTSGALISLAAGKSLEVGGNCTTCHSDPFGTIHPDTIDHTALINVGTTGCGNCHHNQPPLVNPDNPKSHKACTNCHDATGNLISLAAGKSLATGGTCKTCHTGVFATIHPDTIDHTAIVNVRTTVCGKCHHNQPPLVDPANTKSHKACTNCHDTSGALVSRAAGKSFAVGGDCTTCHGDHFPEHTHHLDAATNDVRFNPAVDTAYASQQGCSDCHHDYDKANGTSVGFSIWQAILVEHDLDGTKDGSPNTCYNCHTYDGSKSVPLAAVQNAIASGNPATCATCHTDKAPNHDHGTPTNGKHPQHLAAPGLTCGSCHNTQRFPYFKSGTDGNDLNGDGLYNLQETHVCDDCHKSNWYQ